MLKAPANLRETVMLFAGLRQRDSVADLFAQVDWAGVTQRQLIHAFLDRAPATAAEAHDPPGFDAARAALVLYESASFRDGIVERLVASFPAKRRLLFVHVPKAAGTDFMAAMRGAYPSVASDLAMAEVVPADKMARRFRQLATTVKDADSIFVGGHVNLAWYLDRRLYRFRDRLMAIVRHPHEICVSMANYIVHNFRNDPDLARSDCRAWARALQCDADQIRRADPRALALLLVTHPGTQPVNPICAMLGDGTARGALETMARAPVELTSLAQYSSWLNDRFRIERTTQVNVSDQVIGWSDLSSWQQQRIAASCEEDMVIYQAVLDCLRQNGGLSVTGAAVVSSWRQRPAHLTQPIGQSVAALF